MGLYNKIATKLVIVVNDFLVIDIDLNQDYEIEITYLAQIIAIWAFAQYFAITKYLTYIIFIRSRRL